ncbi:type I-E CRISPR-associated protein Cas7/Cse4/CasC [Zobellella taiwanensis]|uniref:Type I-E CRISPR-associated protein Cas7/Cse4/CasC n=1 Tax=Zobellella taiwanensis TaxID=347535 RepID=A0A2P7R9Q0_9GAMM|nr:type I-E CRISPR-associated protein Cas7/Cse4/CasC [Zobellella taiwanensis]PSJ46957.1 type I-E CRISPR-associated protein Cas7/Cse4/CasC [Zobellella taiwanensis]
MSRFIQIHLLTAYPPANLNRDDQGRPKTAKVGGVDRLRVSSQSLKRHWRTSEIFEQSMSGYMGKRTKLFGVSVFLYFMKNGKSFKKSLEWTKEIVNQFGKLESPFDLKKKSDKDKTMLSARLKKKWVSWDKECVVVHNLSFEDLNELVAVELAQLVFISPLEESLVFALAEKLVSGGEIEKGDLDLLRAKTNAVDIALFGRMLADTSSKNIEAACQVAHAISVHPVVIEDDYFTAVDDLSDRNIDSGSAHIGETGFAAGLFYSYLCINREQLSDNLNGDVELADKAIAALIEAAVKVPPSGKQNSFAHQGYASYVLAEVGNQQPRSLSVAYLRPIEVRGIVDEDYLTQAMAAIRAQRDGFDQVYGPCADRHYELSVNEGKGNLVEMLAFIKDVSH